MLQVLNDFFGVQARGGCACSGPYAQTLLGIDDQLSARFDAGLHRSGQDLLRPGFVRIGIHFSMSRYRCAPPSVLSLPSRLPLSASASAVHMVGLSTCLVVRRRHAGSVPVLKRYLMR